MSGIQQTSSLYPRLQQDVSLWFLLRSSAEVRFLLKQLIDQIHVNKSFVTWTLLTRDISIFTYIPSCWPLVLVSVKIPQSIKFKVLKNFLLGHLPWLDNGCWLPVSSHDFPVYVLISYKDHQPYWIRAHPSDLL